MAGHEKIYGICENKCLVETMSKEQIIDLNIRPLLPIAAHYEVGKFIDSDEVERTVMHYCSGKVNLSDLRFNEDHYSIYLEGITNNIEVVKIDGVGVSNEIQEQAYHVKYSENVKVSLSRWVSTHGAVSYNIYIYCDEGSYNNVLINLYYIK